MWFGRFGINVFLKMYQVQTGLFDKDRRAELRDPVGSEQWGEQSWNSKHTDSWACLPWYWYFICMHQPHGKSISHLQGRYRTYNINNKQYLQYDIRNANSYHYYAIVVACIVALLFRKKRWTFYSSGISTVQGCGCCHGRYTVTQSQFRGAG